MLRLTAEPIVLDELLAAVADPKAGAVVVFIGMTRDNASFGNSSFVPPR